MCYVNKVKFVSLYCTCHTAIVCLDDPITSKIRWRKWKKRFVFTASLFLLLHPTHFVPGRLLSNKDMPTVGQATTWVTNAVWKCMQLKNKTDCNRSISAGLKSNAITDEPKRVLCPFQEDCLVKLDYISQWYGMGTAAIFLIWFQPHNNANKLALKKPELVIRLLSASAVESLSTVVDNSVTYTLYTH